MKNVKKNQQIRQKVDFFVKNEVFAAIILISPFLFLK